MKKLLLLLLVLLLFFASEVFFNLPSKSFNMFRFHALSGGSSHCLQELELYTKDFKSLGTFTDNNCKVKNAVRVTSFKNTKLSGDLILSCPTAVNLGKYLNEIDAKKITHMGTYNCRKISGLNIYSEHSYGTAIDISEIDNVSVLKDWNKKSNNGKILKDAYDAACIYFSNILTPDTNSAHRNHFHFDNGFGTKCYLKWLKK
ncbi:extensin family protein [Candidatus Thioglobus sp.]|nr:extensin family protein [Candidatus Thioglobus sp.]